LCTKMHIYVYRKNCYFGGGVRQMWCSCVLYLFDWLCLFKYDVPVREVYPYRFKWHGKIMRGREGDRRGKLIFLTLGRLGIFGSAWKWREKGCSKVGLLLNGWTFFMLSWKKEHRTSDSVIAWDSDITSSILNGL
jgi:hypothetical protein